ncbi:MAG: ZIP family metal transporter [Saprospirales bacterium]|nr:ZIP family metal transporter [Saprospirales bacterium]
MPAPYFIRSRRRRPVVVLQAPAGQWLAAFFVLHGRLFAGHLLPASAPRGLRAKIDRTRILGPPRFFIQLLLEQLSGGVEHGHIHAHTHAPWNYAFTVMLGLCLHAFMEGMPLAEFSHYQTEHLGHSTSSQYLLLGIVLHHAPAAFALGMLLQWSGFRATTVLLCLLVFSLMSPAGALLAGSFHLGAREEQILISLVIGSFLHISTTILFEADGTHKHRISLFKFVAILAGVLLSLATVLVGD